MTRLRKRLTTLLAAYRRLLRTPLDGSLSPVARRRQAGYNLVEIMIVMAIIGMLMSAAGFGGFAMLERSRRKETRRMMHTIEQALVTWQAEGASPVRRPLTALVEKKFLTKEPKDGWGHSFQFKCPASTTTRSIRQLGQDGKEGTTDDIKSWEEERPRSKTMRAVGHIAPDLFGLRGRAARLFADRDHDRHGHRRLAGRWRDRRFSLAGAQRDPQHGDQAGGGDSL